MTNWTETQSIGYSFGSVEGWLVNDTMQWDSITARVSLVSEFETISGNFDGSLGLSKTYWFGSACTGFRSAPELAYADGSIQSPTVSFLVVRKAIQRNLMLHRH
jgi:hypothetical protein